MGWGVGLSEQARPAAHARRDSRCSRMRAMTLGSVTWPITGSFPPHRGHTLISISTPRLSRAIHAIGARIDGGALGSSG